VRGVDLKTIAARYGLGAVRWNVINEFVRDGLLEFVNPPSTTQYPQAESRRCVRLTMRGRLLSNEVFERFIGTDTTTAAQGHGEAAANRMMR